uniref:Uncharacterized protein n=1 Tax=Avena sativa TaxID=4498 RepID=A0ACD5ZEG3_AVESA
MCMRSMEEQYTEPAADERGTAASDAAPEQEERAGMSGGAEEEAARRPLAAAAWEAEKKTMTTKKKKKSSAGEESARERLKRHRAEMAGRVRIPDMWGQERLLGDWVDCAVFDRPLAATRGLLTARDALVAECAAARRTTHGHGHGATARPLRVQNGCS